MKTRYRYQNRAALKGMNSAQRRARDTVLQKIISGEYQREEVVSCLCKNTTFEKFAERERYGLPMQTRMCKRCGILVQSPRLTQQSLVRFYNSDYRSLYSPAYIREPQQLFEQEAVLGRTVMRRIELLPEWPTYSSVLDVGCGCGGALQPFRDRGWRVVGCDYDENLASHGRQRGLDLVTGGVTEIIHRNQRFDVVLLNDILEHQINPVAFLSELHELLAPQGVVYVQLPGLRNLWTNNYPDVLRDLQLAHTYYWDARQLQYTFALAGFKLVKGNEQIKALYHTVDKSRVARLITEYEQGMSQYYSEIKRFLRKVEKYRLLLFMRNNRGLGFRQPLTFLRDLWFFIRHSW